jgi:AraC family transcriptional regulator
MERAKLIGANQSTSSPHRFTIGGLCRIELLPRAPYETSYMPDRPVIGFAFEAQKGMHAFASSRKEPFHAKPNHLSFVPIGCDVYSQSSHGGEYLKIALDTNCLEFEEAERRFTNFIDPIAVDAAERLRGYLFSGMIDLLCCEHLVHVLQGRVRSILRGDVDEPREATWMTPRRLSLTFEMIEARLDNKLTVHELANGLGLSVGFFSRAFKSAVGKAPHDYMIDRRVARARDMLKLPGMTLTAVANAAGFASHAHMTSMFRERLGVTPSHIRSRSNGDRIAGPELRTPSICASRPP